MDLRGSGKGGDETSNGVVHGNQHVSVHEVWKKQQIHEKSHENAQDQHFLWNIWKMVKASIGRLGLGQKNGQTGRSSDLVQKVFGMCEKK